LGWKGDSVIQKLRKRASEGMMMRFWRMSVTLLSLHIILHDYFRSETRGEFGVSLYQKICLLVKMARNNRRIQTASHFLEHLMMATQILRVPASIEGCVWNAGPSKVAARPTYPWSASCVIVSWKSSIPLLVFEPFSADKEHVLVDLHEIHIYATGAFCGPLEEVGRHNKVRQDFGLSFQCRLFRSNATAFFSTLRTGFPGCRPAGLSGDLIHVSVAVAAERMLPVYP
jgi:hypothetical protein